MKDYKKKYKRTFKTNDCLRIDWLVKTGLGIDVKSNVIENTYR